jgi:hypothetical protein
MDAQQHLVSLGALPCRFPGASATLNVNYKDINQDGTRVQHPSHGPSPNPPLPDWEESHPLQEALQIRVVSA